MITFKNRPRFICLFLVFLLVLEINPCPPLAFAAHAGSADMHDGVPIGPAAPQEPEPPPDKLKPPPCDPTPEQCEVNKSVEPGSEDPKNCTNAEPVYLYDGSFYYRHTDLDIPGRIPITISRAYDTRSAYNGMLGYGWSFNFHMRIFKLADGNLLLKRGDNSKDIFTYNSAQGKYLGPTGVYETITINADGTYTLRKKHGFQYHFNIDGALVKIEDTNANQLQFSYDPAGKLPINGISPYSNITNPIVIGYDWRLTRIEEVKAGTPTGRFVDFIYNSDGRVTKVRDFTSREVIYDYDDTGTGDLVAVIDPEANLYNYVYENHLMTSFVGLGCDCSPHTNLYDSQKRVIKQTEGKRVVDFEYLTAPIRTKVTTKIYNDSTDELLSTRLEYYEFDSDGYTTKYTRQLGNYLDPGGVETDDIVTIFSYYATTKELKQKTNPKGDIINYTYDSKGNLLTESITLDDSTTITTTYTYEPTYNRITSKEISSTAETQTYRTEYTYYADGNLKEEKKILDEATSLTTAYTYTAYGDIETITDPKGNVTKNEYNSYGSLTKVYDPNNPNRKTEYGYDNLGNRTSITDANNHTTTFVYDKLNRVTKIINPKNEETIYTWTDPNLTQLEEGRVGIQEGQITKITYDSLNRKTKIEKKNDVGVFVTLISYTYDSGGNILSTTDALGHTTTNAYDELGRLKSVTDPLTHTTSYEYNKNNNLTKVIDAKNNSTIYTYDKLNRLTQVKDSLNNTTTYTYNAIGEILTITDAENHTTTNTYDRAGRLTKIRDPLNYITQYEYDANGNLLKKIDANNQITEYEYDHYNQLSKVYYGGKASPLKTITFSYDNLGNTLTFNDETYSATYDYDELSRVTAVATTYPFGSKTISYTYDRFGNKKTLIYPDALGTITYNYDNLNRLRTIMGLTGTTTYDYDNAGRLFKKTLPNGVFTDYTYDNANQLTSLVNKKSDATIISTFSYTHDNIGNRLTMTTPEGTHNYVYDTIYRLTSADHPIQTDESYTYDKVGNRKTSSQYNTWTYDANNRLTSYNGTSYTYDNNGNTASKTDASGTTNYTYDYENRLSNFQSPEHQAQYTYDPFGKRLSKTVDGVANYYLYDNEDIIAEYDASGSLTASYTHGQGIDEPIQGLIPQGTVLEWYYTFDGLGTVSELTDANQNIVESYKYDAFGKLETPPTTGNPYTYTGREYDSESGLYFYRARYYDAEVGRFLTQDPITFDGGINFYVYVGNNPLNFVDPTGKVCGYGWNDPLISDRPGGFDFTSACQNHDCCCACSGNKSACAETFLTDMLAICLKYPQLLCDSCAKEAKLYYSVVKSKIGICRKDDRYCKCECEK
jgi:RHS repeat-associated protein